MIGSASNRASPLLMTCSTSDADCLANHLPERQEVLAGDRSALLRCLHPNDEAVEVSDVRGPVGKRTDDDLEDSRAVSSEDPSAGTGVSVVVPRLKSVGKSEKKCQESEELLRGVDLPGEDLVEPSRRLVS